MNETVQDHLAELDRLCRYYQVRRLDLFGSAAAAGTRPGDLDFLVEFEELEPDAYARRLFRTHGCSGGVFDQPVDLIMTSAITNPYFLREIGRSRTVIYGS